MVGGLGLWRHGWKLQRFGMGAGRWHKVSQAVRMTILLFAMLIGVVLFASLIVLSAVAATSLKFQTTPIPLTMVAPDFNQAMRGQAMRAA